MNIVAALRREKPVREPRRDRRERTRWDAPVSLWRDTSRRMWFAPPVTDLDCDVVIVGGGFTGLWTARHLKMSDPGLDVVVLDAQQPGFGGSGRNGGWCSALFPVGDSELDKRFGAGSAHDIRSALSESVDAIGEFARSVPSRCGWVKGGTLTVAVNEGQAERLRESASGSSHGRILDGGELSRRIHVNGAVTAAFDPECAALDPHALVDALLDECRRLGVRIHGGTRVHGVHREHVEAVTDGGLVFVTARRVVVATEAWTSRLRSHRRRVAPVYSYVIATDPLPAAVWEQIGWEGRETVALAGHMVTYAQRTADGRIVLGGRGSPYQFGSDIHSDHDTDDGVHARLEKLMHSLFPPARNARVAYRWGGPLGVARDWMPGVWTDARSGAVHAAGYAGDGVALSHLNARIISALVRGTDDAALALPINGHQPRSWEPEPLRWLGINSALAVARAADAREARSGHRARLLERLLRLF